MIGVCSKGKLIWGFVPSEWIVPQMHTNSPVEGRGPESISLGCSSDIFAIYFPIVLVLVPQFQNRLFAHGAGSLLLPSSFRVDVVLSPKVTDNQGGKGNQTEAFRKPDFGI